MGVALGAGGKWASLWTSYLVLLSYCDLRTEIKPTRFFLCVCLCVGEIDTSEYAGVCVRDASECAGVWL